MVIINSRPYNKQTSTTDRSSSKTPFILSPACEVCTECCMNSVLYGQLTDPVTGNLLCLWIKRLAEFSITGFCWEENKAWGPKLTAFAGCASKRINGENSQGHLLPHSPFLIHKRGTLEYVNTVARRSSCKAGCVSFTSTSLSGRLPIASGHMKTDCLGYYYLL